VKAFEYNMRGVWVKSGKARYRTYVALEHCQKGDMYWFIKKVGRLPEPIARLYAH
jgi:hypothetical protein